MKIEKGGIIMENITPSYKDLKTITEFDSSTLNEPFVELPEEDDFVEGRYEQDSLNMGDLFKRVLVRKQVYAKLLEAAKVLKETNPNYRLHVVYGYRSLEKQQEYFYDIYNKMKDVIKDEDELLEYVHKRIAVPDVAGHPTGGAADLEIYDSAQDKMLDFGSTILDYDDIKCNYYNDDLSEEAKANRKLLRDVMLSQNFAPFNGEWWHYCYGDKEWAFYYKKDKALYSQMPTNEVLDNIER